MINRRTFLTTVAGTGVAALGGETDAKRGRTYFRARGAALVRGQRFVSEAWSEQIVRQLGLESTVRSRGRPRKVPSLRFR